MQEFLENKYVFWIITAILAGLVGLIITLLRKRQSEMDKRIDKLSADIHRVSENLNDFLRQMPIQYTLRDEFLRVTTDQYRSTGKLMDSTNAILAKIAAIETAITGGVRHGD